LRAEPAQRLLPKSLAWRRQAAAAEAESESKSVAAVRPSSGPSHGSCRGPSEAPAGPARSGSRAVRLPRPRPRPGHDRAGGKARRHPTFRVSRSPARRGRRRHGPRKGAATGRGHVCSALRPEAERRFCGQSQVAAQELSETHSGSKSESGEPAPTSSGPASAARDTTGSLAVGPRGAGSKWASHGPGATTRWKAKDGRSPCGCRIRIRVGP